MSEAVLTSSSSEDVSSEDSSSVSSSSSLLLLGGGAACLNPTAISRRRPAKCACSKQFGCRQWAHVSAKTRAGVCTASH